MGNAVAHLTRTDNPDCFNVHDGWPFLVPAQCLRPDTNGFAPAETRLIDAVFSKFAD
jgi:hypothetical protein